MPPITPRAHLGRPAEGPDFFGEYEGAFDRGSGDGAWDAGLDGPTEIKVVVSSGLDTADGANDEPSRMDRNSYIEDGRSFLRNCIAFSIADLVDALRLAGRAGRHGHRGLVILQTRNVQIPVIQQVVNHDFLAMYDQQVEERELFRYPPFYRMINLYLKHRDEDELSKAARQAADMLYASFGKQRIRGPDKPVVPRVQSLYIRKLVIKLEQTAPLAQVRNSLRVLIAKISEQNHGLTVYFDVDPQ